MTPQEIRIAVAEECGWELDLVHSGLALWKGPKGEMFGHGQLPLDYCNDLNAIHEAEKTLSDTQILDYQGRLAMICSTAFVRATALQRCEAFLCVKGKWKE